jgi:aerobic-type carbon monoxide dehydrogenase small subunit (CoxS/CutS family)
MVDGTMICSCLMLAVEAEGKKVETIEGMAKGEALHPLQRNFLELNGLQCGSAHTETGVFGSCASWMIDTGAPE